MIFGEPALASVPTNGENQAMNRIDTLLFAILSFTLSGCSNSDGEKENSTVPVMFPNYLAINTPSRDPDKPWYVSDFAMKVEQWNLEKDIDLNELKLGMYELTQYPNQEPTQTQYDAAAEIIEQSYDVVIRNGWLSKEKAFLDGYEKMFGDPVHYVNKEYVFDGETLNPEKPEVLMYYKTRDGEYLLGIMFLAIGQRGPQIAGPLSEWHYHIDRKMCYQQGVLPIDRVTDDGECGSGFHNIRSPEMLHVWFFDHPDGRFATTMWLSEDQLNAGVKQVLELVGEQP